MCKFWTHFCLRVNILHCIFRFVKFYVHGFFILTIYCGNCKNNSVIQCHWHSLEQIEKVANWNYEDFDAFC